LVFWHRYWDHKDKRFMEGPYGDRKKIMRTLCKKVGVRCFRFHPLRHAGASIMDQKNVPNGAIQRILGHENRRTTKVYLHSVGLMERDAMAVYERAREKSHAVYHRVEEGQKKRSLLSLLRLKSAFFFYIPQDEPHQFVVQPLSLRLWGRGDSPD
jgi:integrase